MITCVFYCASQRFIQEEMCNEKWSMWTRAERGGAQQTSMRVIEYLTQKKG